MLQNENVVSNRQPAKAKKVAKSIEETYTKMTQLEHILLRPDTYIGSIEKQTQSLWLLDPLRKKMNFRQCTYVPGLFKIFDEIIVNASDNKQRDPTMSKIEVMIDAEENCIRVWNNGKGIPIVIHQDHQIYVPELIFGHLLTGSNFDDKEEKTTGGRNGYGAKLANIFSSKFIVETADSSRGLRYKQEFRNNMSAKDEPRISPYDGSDFTCVTFYPDLARFKMDQLDEDIIGLLSKRAYDIAATGGKMRVHLNGQRIEVNRFEQYLELFEGIDTPIHFERISERWEIGVGVSDGSFQHISFVNSISTSKGGAHVAYIADKIVSKLAAVVKKRNKGEEVKPNQIKNHLAIFVNALIVNPAFDSQTKENLTTKAANFGSTCDIPEKMIKAIEKSPIIDNILNWSKLKQVQELKKKSGSKHSKVLGITKLDDANHAGTSKSSQCTLILTEGDSAKALAISGIGVVGRDFYGAFPLKGKLLNVREASHAQIMKNEEIQNITKILGLTFGKTYTDTSSLRYGHLMIMTDQDHDGSHIKGLLINFLHHFWPSLLQIEGFLQQFITPIVKCTRGKNEIPFYTIPEYKEWKAEHDDGKGWKVKYYKGLGTSTAAEAKDYFSNLPTHEVDFAWDVKADDMIEMAFAKKRVEDRKLWLLSLQPGVFIDYTSQRVTYDNFVNRELILFSHADNERSIGHFMDGFKPSQRKVIYACFKRNLKQEIKVAQLAGYVSEHSAYHHGEVSLTQTIIGMAQNFVGSNNINLLSPCGQFGTRLMGGKDAASPRYVFTKLESITRLIFHPDDDPLLDYLEDDGESIEPLYYVPIIPMALVNGCEGIGTGWSSSVPTYNPREIIENLKRMIRGEEPEEMLPWFRGFTGSIQRKTVSSFTVTGTLEQIDDQTVRISELPVGKWTTDYKQFLESALIGTVKEKKDDDANASTGAPFVKDFKEHHTDTTVMFTVTAPAEKLQEFEAEKGGLVKKFKLDTSISTTNMHMFDLGSQIKKYSDPMHLLKEFFNVRMQYYDHRKSHLLNKLGTEYDKLDNKVRFLIAVIRGEIVVSNRKKSELLLDIQRYGLRPFYEDSKNTQTENGADDEEAVVDSKQSLEKGYDYLLSLKLWNLTMEKVQELTAQRDGKRRDVDELNATTAEQLWLNDLARLEEALDSFDDSFEDAKQQELAAKKKARGGKGGSSAPARRTKKPAAAKKSKRAADSEDDDDDDDDDEDNSDPESEFEEEKKKKTVKAAPKKTTAAAPVKEKFAPIAKAAPVREPLKAKAVTEEFAGLSLFERLQAKNASSAPVALKAKPTAKAVAAEKPKAKVSKKKAYDSEEEDGDSDVMDVDEPAPVVQRSKRAAAVVKKSYVVDLVGDDEDAEFDDEDHDDFSEAEDDDDEEEEFEMDSPVKSKAKPKAVAAKAAPAPVKAVSKAPPAAAAAANKGKKRIKRTKGDDSDEDEDEDVFSASPIPTPQLAKKARANNSKAIKSVAKKLDLAPAAKKAPAAAPAAKAKGTKAAPKKSKAADSDEEDDDDEMPAVIARNKSPKPQRQRKQTNYAYDSEEDEDAEDSFIADEDDDEEDFSEVD